MGFASLAMSPCPSLYSGPVELRRATWHESSSASVSCSLDGIVRSRLVEEVIQVRLENSDILSSTFFLLQDHVSLTIVFDSSLAA